MIKIFGIGLIIFFAWAFYDISQDNFEAMKLCQKTHSYDTCAWDILR